MSMSISPVLAALPVLIVCISLTACVIGPELEVAPAAAEASVVRVKWLHAYRQKDSVFVSGLMKRAGPPVGPARGAVLIEVPYADGSLPAARCIPARNFIHPRAMAGGFSASIRIDSAKPIGVIRYSSKGSC